MVAIETDGLTKRFRGSRHIPGIRGATPAVTAVEDLDLRVHDGEVFGFLGPNGAGKSTTINVLLGYVNPTSGRAEVLGMDAQTDAATVHERIGVLHENLGLWDPLTAREHLRFARQTKNAEDEADELLERVGLSDAADKQVGEFSTGMRKRLSLAMALVGDPDLLILDEPTTGLDPNGIRRLREIVRTEADRGTTVFFSSHVLEQVEAVCDRVGILNEGELVALDTIDGLREELDLGDRLTVVLESPVDGVADALAEVDGIASTGVNGREITARCTTGPAKADAISAVREAGGTIADVRWESTDLETLFAAYAGDEAGQDENRDEPTERVEVNR